MATVAQAVVPRRKTNPDRVFYPLMCLLILITVWIGFSKTYYAVGMVRAKLPSAVVHVHAVAFSLWLVTLVTQIGLVTARKVKLHMALGLWGFGLAAAMVVLGFLAATDALRRGMSPPGSGLSAQTFYVVPITGIVLFGIFTGLSFMNRRKPQVHKRLIMFATIVTMAAALGRFPMGPLGQTLAFAGFLLVMVIYDVVSLKKVLPVTWICAVISLAVDIGNVPFGMTHAWQAFANFMKG